MSPTEKLTFTKKSTGKAIAIRAARDITNVVIAAKTAEKHPELRGTIYTAADEIEAQGGKALPCCVRSNAIQRATAR